MSGVKPIVSNASNHQCQPKTIIADRAEYLVHHHIISPQYIVIWNISLNKQNITEICKCGRIYFGLQFIKTETISNS